jgi:hypothetical protein
LLVVFKEFHSKTASFHKSRRDRDWRVRPRRGDGRSILHGHELGLALDKFGAILCIGRIDLLIDVANAGRWPERPSINPT